MASSAGGRGLAHPAFGQAGEPRVGIRGRDRAEIVRTASRLTSRSTRAGGSRSTSMCVKPRSVSACRQAHVCHGAGTPITLAHPRPSANACSIEPRASEAALEASHPGRFSMSERCVRICRSRPWSIPARMISASSAMFFSPVMMRKWGMGLMRGIAQSAVVAHHVLGRLACDLRIRLPFAHHVRSAVSARIQAGRVLEARSAVVQQRLKKAELGEPREAACAAVRRSASAQPDAPRSGCSAGKKTGRGGPRGRREARGNALSSVSGTDRGLATCRPGTSPWAAARRACCSREARLAWRYSRGYVPAFRRVSTNWSRSGR